jgi:hypothetical protein
MDDPTFPASLLRIEPDPKRTRRPPPRPPNAPPSNRQLAADNLPVRAPRFKLVSARDDPYLGPECAARAGRPAGFRPPHPSDDELGPATTFTAKFKYFHETSVQFSNRVARAYYAGELSDEAIASLHGDLSALVFLQRLSLRCTEDPSVPSAPRGLVRLREIMDSAEALLPVLRQRGLGTVLREKMEALILKDAALPPGMFRPAEFDALSALVGQQSAEREGQGASDQDAEGREPIGVIEGTIGGIAMAATAGGTLPRQTRPAAQRTPHVHALVDSGCNQHLLKDLSLFVTLDRKRAMQPFTVASDRATVPQGYGTAQFGVTDEQGDLLTITLPGCYLDDTIPFNLLSVSQATPSCWRDLEPRLRSPGAALS